MVKRRIFLSLVLLVIVGAAVLQVQPTKVTEAYTQTFSNTTSIAIRDNDSSNPYGTTITVSGVPGRIVDVNVALNGVTHGNPDDLDIMVQGPGANVQIISDACGTDNVSNRTWTFDDQAASAVSNDGPCNANATYRPANYTGGSDAYDSPAPGGPYGNTLASFNNADPNGSWRLWVMDDNNGSNGSNAAIAGGWSLILVTSSVTVSQTPASSPAAGTTITENGPNDNYTIQLDTAPTANVSVVVDPNNQCTVNGGAAGAPVTLTFTSANGTTAQTVTVAAVDDLTVEGAHTCTITQALTSTDAAYNNLTVPNTVVNIVDNDPYVLSATSGTPQSAAVSAAFANPLAARLLDANGRPIVGTSVTFTAPNTGASGTFAATGTRTQTLTTDATGTVTTSVFTANATAGTYTVAAVTGTTPSFGPANFTLTNTNNAPAAIIASGGTPQSTVVNTAFGASLQATVLNGSGNPVAGISVTFSAPGAGASATFPSGNTAITNAAGIASVPVNANTIAGSYSVTANITPALPIPASFNLTNTPSGPASITATGGTPQSTTVNSAFGAALEATVVDAFGNPISGVTVTFTAPGAGASATFPGGNTAATNAAGVASVAVSANATAGGYSVTANVTPALPIAANFALTNTSSAPAGISVSGGSNQSTIVNTAFAAPLQAAVVDAFSNPLIGVTVTFTAPGAGASATFPSGNTAITDAAGVASVLVNANSVAGSYSVTANVSPDLPTPATYTLTNTPSGPASITATGGTPQSTTVNSAFGAALEATVVDAFGNPISGVTVTFTAPGAGASATFPGGNTAATNAAGVASVAVSANATAGGYSVTANVTPALPIAANFALTNTNTVPGSINVIGGNNQTTTVNTAFASALTVQVLDGSGNPLAGVVVTYTAPGVGASAIFPSGNNALTDASGFASVPVNANSTAGSYIVIADTAPSAGGVSFNLTNTSANINISPTSGLNADEDQTLHPTYTIVLTGAPTNDVAVSITPDSQCTTDLSSVTFTTGNWATPQTVTITAVNDGVVEAAVHTCVISHNASSSDPNYNSPASGVSVNIVDNDGAGLFIDPSTINLDEDDATPATYNVRLTNAPQIGEVVTVNLSFDATQITVSPTSLVYDLSTWNVPQQVTVTAIPDGLPENEGFITVISHVSSSNLGVGSVFNGLSADVIVAIGDALAFGWEPACVFSDNRLNGDYRWDCIPPVAIYCVENGIDIYSIDAATSRGSLYISVSQEEIDALGVSASEAIVIAERPGVVLYRLASGEYQVNAWSYDPYWPNNSKPYAITWDACPPSNITHHTFSQ